MRSRINATRSLFTDVILENPHRRINHEGMPPLAHELATSRHTCLDEHVIRIYVYAKCSTCRDALNWLESHGIAHDCRPIRETPPSIQELKKALGHLGGSIRKLFNTSGMDYRALSLKDKLPSMSVDEALKLLNSNGMLVKRPLVLGRDFTLAGFRPAEWEKHLLG